VRRARPSAHPDAPPGSGNAARKPQALGAYEIIDRLTDKSRPAPITIYRALDFLRENGFVHRIESRNAFVACVRDHGGDDIVVFLICERCGAIGFCRNAR
jgi:Fur family zinc uptake transcriptional regulator